MAPNWVRIRCIPRELVRLKVLANWLRGTAPVCPASAAVRSRRGWLSGEKPHHRHRRARALPGTQDGGIAKGLKLGLISPAWMSSRRIPERQKVRDDRRPD